MIERLSRHTKVLEIVGDIIKVRGENVGYGDLAVIENFNGEESLAQVVHLDQDEVSLQVFSGGRGLSTRALVRFLGHPMQVVYSSNILVSWLLFN